MPDPVHQLTASKVENGRRTITAKCGATFTEKGVTCSDHVTAWGSLVTCSNCKEASNA